VAEVVIVDAAALPAVGARWIAERAASAATARGRFDVALSGGSTPRPIYEALAGMDLPWRQVHIWFADERCVPPDHPDSNYRMARLALLDHVPAEIHRIEGERDPDAVAADYAAALPDVLDAILLGMGEDLHTASLAPGVDWSRPTGKKVLHVTGFPKPPPDRITITPDVIAAARALLVAVTGAGKAAQVALALTGSPDPKHYPIHVARRATWLLDRAAAAQIQESSHV
jgi:6-phosphogluconolactonase